MTNPGTCEALQAILHQRIVQLPEYRQGQNAQDGLKDAAAGACVIFFTQSPSFVDHQRTLQHRSKSCPPPVGR